MQRKGVQTLLAVSLAACTWTLAACEHAARSVAGELTGPNLHVGCNAGIKFTGGGRVDPVGIGKVTFGFNVNGSDVCPAGGPPRGQIQVVYHEAGPSLYHSVELTHFSSYPSDRGGQCGEWDGTVRAKHVHEGEWHRHHFFMQVCDNGEPGRDDTFSFSLDGPYDGKHNNVINEKLTGGNIQAHKS